MGGQNDRFCVYVALLPDEFWRRRFNVHSFIFWFIDVWQPCQFFSNQKIIYSSHLSRTLITLNQNRTKSQLFDSNKFENPLRIWNKKSETCSGYGMPVLSKRQFTTRNGLKVLRLSNRNNGLDSVPSQQRVFALHTTFKSMKKSLNKVLNKEDDVRDTSMWKWD